MITMKIKEYKMDIEAAYRYAANEIQMGHHVFDVDAEFGHMEFVVHNQGGSQFFDVGRKYGKKTYVVELYMQPNDGFTFTRLTIMRALCWVLLQSLLPTDVILDQNDIDHVDALALRLYMYLHGEINVIETSKTLVNSRCASVSQKIFKNQTYIDSMQRVTRDFSDWIDSVKAEIKTHERWANCLAVMPFDDWNMRSKARFYADVVGTVRNFDNELRRASSKLDDNRGLWSSFKKSLEDVTGDYYECAKQYLEMFRRYALVSTDTCDHVERKSYDVMTED